MERFSFRTIAPIIVLTLALLQSTHAQVGLSDFGASGLKTCDQIRQETAHAFQATYGAKVPAHLVNAMLSAWVESLLPRRCHKALEMGGPFNPSSHNDHVGPLGTVGGPSTVYTTSIKEEVGVARQKRAVSETEEKALPNVRAKRFVGGLSGLSSMFPGMSMSMTGRRGAGQKEVSESAQMMKTLLLISKIQKRRALQDVKRSYNRNQGYSGEKYNFGTGLYGDTYPGKRKRRSVDSSAASSLVDAGSSSAQPLSRKKRFLFMGEPADAPSGPAMPSMMSILMGTARDPATGKKVEFGGDYMKQMMRTSFMQAMPGLGGNTPPGKEPPDVVKALAPLWYFSRMQRAMAPRRAPSMMDGYDNYSMMRRASPASVKSRNKDGYYGDHFPGMGKRKRRSVDSDINTSFINDSSSRRVKRAAGESNNDVITIGDVSIPTDFFKPPDRTEDPKYYGGYQKPDDARYYHQYTRPQYNYHYQPPQSSRYQQQQQYYRQQLARQKQQQQQQRQQFYKYYRHLYSLYLQALQAKKSPPAQNQWSPPATPQAPYSPPPAQQQAPPAYPAQAHAQAPPPPNNFAPPPKSQAPPTQAQFPPPRTHTNNIFGPPYQTQPLHQQPTRQNYAPPPAQSHYHHAPPPSLTYPVDPFIPNPPLPPPRFTTVLPSRKRRSADLTALTLDDSESPSNAQLLRHKRSEDNDKTEKSYGNFFFPQSMFSSPFYSPYFASRYPIFSNINKVGYRQPRGGGVIYGDKLPWTSSWVQPQTPARPTSPAAPLSHQPPLAAQHANRRVKRSDNKDNPDSYPNFFFGPPFFSSFMPPAQTHHNKLAYSTGRGGVVYGDQMPWTQPQTSARSYSYSHMPAAGAPPITSPAARPTGAPSGGLLDHYLNARAQKWGHRG